MPQFGDNGGAKVSRKISKSNNSRKLNEVDIRMLMELTHAVGRALPPDLLASVTEQNERDVKLSLKKLVVLKYATLHRYEGDTYYPTKSGQTLGLFLVAVDAIRKSESIDPVLRNLIKELYARTKD